MVPLFGNNGLYLKRSQLVKCVSQVDVCIWGREVYVVYSLLHICPVLCMVGDNGIKESRKGPLIIELN